MKRRVMKFSTSKSVPDDFVLKAFGNIFHCCRWSNNSIAGSEDEARCGLKMKQRARGMEKLALWQKKN